MASERSSRIRAARAPSLAAEPLESPLRPGVSAMDSSRAPLSPAVVLAVVAGVTVAGAVLRGIRLGRQSFWYDEAVSVERARDSVLSLVTGARRDLGNPPLYYVLLRIWTGIFGAGDSAARSLSVVFGVASVPLLFLVARRLVSQRAALAATALLALAPVHVYFAQEARGYALVTFLCLASFASLLRALAAPARPWPWVPWAAATFLALYTHYGALFVVLAQVVHLLATQRPRVLARAALALAAAALLYGTWLPSLAGQATTPGNLARSADTWHLQLAGTPLVFCVGTTLLWKDTLAPLRVAAAVLALLGFGVALVAGLRALHAHRPARRLLVLWCVAPVILPTVISMALFPLYSVRYALLASPALYILVGAGIEALPRRPRFAAVGTMAMTAAASLGLYYTGTFKHDWRAAARYVDDRARPGDVVVFDADIGETAFAHYGARSAPRFRLLPPGSDPRAPVFYGAESEGAPGRDLGATLLASARVWLVLSDQKLGSGGHYEDAFDRRFRRTSTVPFRGVDVRLYEPLLR